MAATKLQAGSRMPEVSLPQVGGGHLSLDADHNWKLVVVYRGKHCPLCRAYLKTLDGLLEQQGIPAD